MVLGRLVKGASPARTDTQGANSARSAASRASVVPRDTPVAPHDRPPPPAARQPLGGADHPVHGRLRELAGRQPGWIGHEHDDPGSGRRVGEALHERMRPAAGSHPVDEHEAGPGQATAGHGQRGRDVPGRDLEDIRLRGERPDHARELRSSGQLCSEDSHPQPGRSRRHVG